MQNRDWISLKLLTPNRAKNAWLVKTLSNYQMALQKGLEVALSHTAANRNQVHQLVYPLARQLGLPSALARPLVTQVLSSMRSMRRNHSPTDPSRPIIGLGSTAYSLVPKGERWYLRLTTGRDGRLWFPLIVPNVFDDRIEHAKGDARLEHRGQEWFVHLPLQKPDSKPVNGQSTKTWIGVDLGIARLAVVAAPDQILVISGQSLRRRKQHVDRLVDRYQNQRRFDRAGQVREAEGRWMQAVNHQVSRQIVDLASKYPNAGLVLENLDGLFYQKWRSHRFTKMRSAWNFPQLVHYIVHKAEEVGVRVIFVDPRGTSHTCPRCQHSAPANTDSQGCFHCLRCGYQGNSDVVAAHNLTLRGTEENNLE